ncbi:MAG: nickel-binding protein [Gaiellaceae bacterium]
MVDASTESFLAECFWPDVGDADLAALERRIAAATAELNEQRRFVRYLGSLLLRDDEVVFCQFEGTAESVREAAERAQVPFERILAADRSPWHSTGYHARGAP